MSALLPNPLESRAVLVGVSQYRRLDSLPAVHSNIVELQALLRDSRRWGLPRRNCTALDQPTTSAKVLDVLHDQAARATDTLLFYFAGHGLVDERDDDELFLALPDADPERPNRDAIPYSWIRNEVLDASRAKRKIVIIDCCYSGRALGQWMSDGSPMPDVLEIAGTCVLTATARTKMALAPDGQPYTAFTGALIEALRKGIPDGPELLDLDTLYRFALRQLVAHGWPRPKRGELDNGGLVAIGRNIAYRLAAPSDTQASPSPRPTAPRPTTHAPPSTGKPRRRPEPVAEPSASGRRSIVIQLDPDGRQSAAADAFERTFRVPMRSEAIAGLGLTLAECVFGTTVEVVLETPRSCMICRGTGTVHQSRCVACDGTGGISRETVSVRVPAGVRDGQTLRVPGRGNLDSSGRRGHIHLTVHEEDGPLRRDGDDLHYQLTVPMTFVALGGNAVIPVLGRAVNVRVEQGTQDGTTIVLQGQGLPRRDGDGNGYLEIQINVPTPTALTAKQKDLLMSFVHERPQDQPRADAGFTGRAYATVPMAIAALGTTLMFDDYTGHVRVELEPGCQNGTKVPYRRRGREESIDVKVVVPTPANFRQRELLRALAAERGETPRRPPRPAEPTPSSIPPHQRPFTGRRRRLFDRP
jgi:DnaJ-class molecular chaperone